MSELKDMHHNLMHLTARVGALESITRMFVALICSYDNRPEALDRLTDSVFPLLIQQAEKKTYQTTHPELSDWLVTQEVQILKAEVSAILEQVEEIRQKARRSIQ